MIEYELVPWLPDIPPCEENYAQKITTFPSPSICFQPLSHPLHYIEHSPFLHAKIKHAAKPHYFSPWAIKKHMFHWFIILQANGVDPRLGAVAFVEIDFCSHEILTRLPPKVFDFWGSCHFSNWLPKTVRDLERARWLIPKPSLPKGLSNPITRLNRIHPWSSWLPNQCVCSVLQRDRNRLNCLTFLFWKKLK